MISTYSSFSKLRSDVKIESAVRPFQPSNKDSKVFNENLKPYLENLIVLRFLGANSIYAFDNFSLYSSIFSSSSLPV